MNKNSKSFLLFLICSFSALQATTKIMSLGDSITWDWYYGDIRTDAERSGYRNYLWYQLQDGGYSVDFVGSKNNGGAVQPTYDGDNEGYTGWTSYQIADKVYHFLEMNTPKIILLHIGTNDSVYYPNAGADGVERILNEIDRFEIDKGVKIKVVLAQIISLQKDPSWVSRFNNNLGEMAQNRIDNGDDIFVVDMEHGAGIDYWNDLIDGIHPDNNGYKKMADVWYGAIRGILTADHHNPRMMADVDGDGTQDVVGFGNAGVMVALSNGSGFDKPRIWVNNFGSNDGWSTSKHPRMMADVDGDGTQDVVGFGNAGVFVAPSSSIDFDTATLWIKDFGFGQGWMR